MKVKTPVEIKKQLKGTKNKLKDDKKRCADLGVDLQPGAAGYMEGVIWAMEWVLGQRD